MIKYIIIHYLYENPLEPIEIKEIHNELEELNTLFENAWRENPKSLANILARYKRKIDNNDSSESNNKFNTETAKVIKFFSESSSNK